MSEIKVVSSHLPFVRSLFTMESSRYRPQVEAFGMTQSTDWGEQILVLAKERDMSLRELAADLGVSHVYLGNVVRGQRAASAKLKIKIWARQNCDLPRERMLELLLPCEVAEEFRAFEAERARCRIGSSMKCAQIGPSAEANE